MPDHKFDWMLAELWPRRLLAPPARLARPSGFAQGATESRRGGSFASGSRRAPGVSASSAERRRTREHTGGLVAAGRVYILIDTVIDPSPHTASPSLPAVLICRVDTMLRVSCRQGAERGDHLPYRQQHALEHRLDTRRSGFARRRRDARLRRRSHECFLRGRLRGRGQGGLLKGPAIRLEPWEEVLNRL